MSGAYVEVDLIVAVLLTDTSGASESRGIGAAKLHRDRVLLHVVGQHLSRVVEHGAQAHHLRVPARLAELVSLCFVGSRMAREKREEYSWVWRVRRRTK